MNNYCQINYANPDSVDDNSKAVQQNTLKKQTNKQTHGIYGKLEPYIIQFTLQLYQNFDYIQI